MDYQHTSIRDCCGSREDGPHADTCVYAGPATRPTGGPFPLRSAFDQRVMDALSRAIDCVHTVNWVVDLKRELGAEGLVIVERGSAGPGYVAIYDVPTDGVDVDEQYYGFFSSVEEARDQYLQMRAPEYRDAKVAMVVEAIDVD